MQFKVTIIQYPYLKVPHIFCEVFWLVLLVWKSMKCCNVILNFLNLVSGDLSYKYALLLLNNSYS